MSDALIESWQIHNRIMLYVLDAIPEAALAAKPQPSGRSVGEQFAHVHNVRLMWLKEALPERAAAERKLEKGAALTVEVLRSALESSGAAVEELLEHAREAERVRGFRPHRTAFVAYLIAHESHHRGQVVLILKQAGQPLDRKVLYGIWEWGSR